MCNQECQKGAINTNADVNANAKGGMISGFGLGLNGEILHAYVDNSTNLTGPNVTPTQVEPQLEENLQQGELQVEVGYTVSHGEVSNFEALIPLVQKLQSVKYESTADCLRDAQIALGDYATSLRMIDRPIDVEESEAIRKFMFEDACALIGIALQLAMRSASHKPAASQQEIAESVLSAVGIHFADEIEQELENRLDHLAKNFNAQMHDMKQSFQSQLTGQLSPIGSI